VSLVRAFQAAAERRGLTVVASDMNPQLSSACHIAKESIALPRVTDRSFPRALLEYCKANEVKLVIPTIDTELALLSLLRLELLKIGCFAVVCDSEIVAVCRDKRKTADYFQNFGLVSPRLYALDEISYPVLVKPYNGSLSSGVAVLRTASDFTDSMAKNTKNIFCQYLDPSEYEEFTCDAYFNRNGELCCVVPRLRIEVRGGEVSKGRTMRNNIVSFLFDKLRILNGARGCLTVQIMRHRETEALYLIEINPRFGGGYPLTAQSGAEYHAWLIDEYLFERNIERFDNWIDRLTMIRYDSEVFWVDV
jgi:carbamoyl-phosphate synthase large subunit